MDAFVAILAAFCLAGSYRVGASYCVSDKNGLCSWTAPIDCENPEQYCGPGAQCLIVSKSINASYDSSSGANQQFQCRCPVGAPIGDCNPYPSQDYSLDCITNPSLENPVVIYAQDPGLTFLSIVYAEMWKCSDNSAINCPIQRKSQGVGTEFGCKGDAQLLPNVLALVRFWCQDKATCEFDPSLIISHVDPSNNSTSLSYNYVFEWAQESIREDTFICSKYATESNGSCYRLTPPNLEWKDARSYCLSLGGDLALFTNQTNFASVLQNLDSSIPPLTNASVAIPTWFKWYSWNGEQRMPQHFLQFTDGFQCNVYDYQSGIGPNPLARCYAGRRTKKARGLCVLPPISPLDNFEYKNVTCSARCIPGYNETYCWNDTAIDTERIKDCPDPFSGEARWKCGINGQWATPSPDLSNCTNPLVDTNINKANEALRNNTDPSKTLNYLSDAIRVEKIASGNIAQLDETVKLAIEKQRELLVSTAKSRDQSSQNFTNSVLDLKDILLASNEAFWGLNLIPREIQLDHVQNNIDETLFLLAQNIAGIYRNGNFSNIAVQVENQQDYKNKTYTYVAGDRDQLILPKGFPYEVNDPTTLLSFSVYPDFQQILHGDTLALLRKTGYVEQPLRQVLVSKVVGSTIGQPNGSIHLKGDKVEILLSTLNLDLYDVDELSAKCVYWDVSTQEWSTDGCELVSTNDKSTTRCRCDHLTNFAVLMDINGLFQNKTVPALDYITVIGESISIACLTLAVIMFYSLRNLRRDFRFHIHRNLCLNLLIAEILLLVGIDATSNKDLCLSIGVFLHLFFLCAFCWMLVEGLYMYFLVTRVFEGSGLKRWQYYIIGYGFPILVVSITLIATNTSAYQNPYYCWLSYDNGAIWAFAAPVAAIVLMNLIFLITTLSIAFNSKRNKLRRKEEHSFQWIAGTASLTFVLGITWLFGFLYFNQGSMAMAYIFTILNSLQGLIIFITFFILNKQVRSELHKQIVSNKYVASVLTTKMTDSRSQNDGNKIETNSSQIMNTKMSSSPNAKTFPSNEYF